MTKKLPSKQGPSNSKYSMRDSKRLVSTRNKGVDRNNVLSSGRALPSSHGWEHLAGLCERQHAYVWRVTKNLADKEQGLRDRIAKLNQDHSRDRSRLSEVPNFHLLKQRLAVLFQEVDAANEVMAVLQDQYKRATGSPWKPKPNINEPLYAQDNKTTKRGTKAPIR